MEKTNKPPFSEGLKNLELRLMKQQCILSDIKRRWEQKDTPGAYDAAFKLVDEMEKATLIARVLPAHTGHPQALKCLNDRFIRKSPVEAGFTREGWFCMKIPSLLPKKKGSSASYLRDMVYPAAENFFRGRPPVRYANCVLIIRHVYDRRRPDREYRDHDNIEVSAIVNIVSRFVLHDDSAMRCKHYYCSAPGDEDHAEAYVVPESEFISWLAYEKNLQNGRAGLHGHPRRGQKNRCIKRQKKRRQGCTAPGSRKHRVKSRGLCRPKGRIAPKQSSPLAKNAPF